MEEQQSNNTFYKYLTLFAFILSAIGVLFIVVSFFAFEDDGIVIGKGGFYINSPLKVTSGVIYGDETRINIVGEVGNQSAEELQNVKIYAVLSTNFNSGVVKEFEIDVGNIMPNSTKKIEVKDGIVDRWYGYVISIKYSHSTSSGINEIENKKFDIDRHTSIGEMTFRLVGFIAIFIATCLLIIIAIEKKQTKEKEMAVSGENDFADKESLNNKVIETQCMFCGQKIKSNMQRCPHCRAKLN